MCVLSAIIPAFVCCVYAHHLVLRAFLSGATLLMTASTGPQWKRFGWRGVVHEWMWEDGFRVKLVLVLRIFFFVFLWSLSEGTADWPVGRFSRDKNLCIMIKLTFYGNTKPQRQSRTRYEREKDMNDRPAWRLTVKYSSSPSPIMLQPTVPPLSLYCLSFLLLLLRTMHVCSAWPAERYALHVLVRRSV